MQKQTQERLNFRLKLNADRIPPRKASEAMRRGIHCEVFLPDHGVLMPIPD